MFRLPDQTDPVFCLPHIPITSFQLAIIPGQLTWGTYGSDPGSVPDDGDELGHGELVRHQELGLVQRWKKLLAFVALDDNLRGGEGAEMVRETPGAGR